MLERRDIRKWRGIDCEIFFQVQTNILVYQVNSDVYKLKSTSTNLCCYSCVKKSFSRGLKFSTLWLLHFFSTFLELDVRDLTLFFNSWTFGNCRVNNNWQNWNSYSCNEFHGRLHNCRFKSLHLVLFWFLQNSSST